MKFNFSLRFVRYFLIIFSIVIFTYTIQIFVQNFNVEKEIKTLKKTQYQLSGDTYWIKNYYEPFLKTDYAKMIFKHKAWIIQDNELLVKIKYFSDNPTDMFEKKQDNLQTENIENIKCLDYFKKLYEKYFTL